MSVPTLLVQIWLLPAHGAVFFKTLLSRRRFMLLILDIIFNTVLWSTLLFRAVDLIRVISMQG